MYLQKHLGRNIADKARARPTTAPMLPILMARIEILEQTAAKGLAWRMNLSDPRHGGSGHKKALAAAKKKSRTQKRGKRLPVAEIIPDTLPAGGVSFAVSRHQSVEVCICPVC